MKIYDLKYNAKAPKGRAPQGIHHRGDIAGLSAAVQLVDDVHMPGKNIVVLETDYIMLLTFPTSRTMCRWAGGYGLWGKPSYTNMVKRSIIPYFEDKKYTLQDLEKHPKYIQDYYQSELNAGLSANTIIHRHANIRKCLQYAFQIGLIRSNPADRIERPRKVKYVATIYNQQELEELFRAVRGDPIELVVILAAFYGLRRSEVVGLKWDAIDFEKKTISIQHTVTQVSVDGKNVVIQKDRTKTKSSCRTLPLVPPFERLLRRLQMEQKTNQKVCGNAYCKDYLDYIYVNEIGELVKPNFLTQHFETVLKKNGLKKIRFHDLRHSCASLLYANGVSLKEIQEWLGHSDIGTTSNIYTHLDYSSKVSSANAILACYPTAAK
ncbi:MAG: tyrosine-type recombinase/integrase [Candidatus Onthomonas sp.]